MVVINNDKKSEPRSSRSCVGMLLFLIRTKLLRRTVGASSKKDSKCITTQKIFSSYFKLGKIMSIKNKAKDRDEQGRIKRKYTGPFSTYCYSTCRKSWRYFYMTRPRRRANKRVCDQVRLGVDPDGIITPLGNNKPHEYYW